MSHKSNKIDPYETKLIKEGKNKEQIEFILSSLQNSKLVGIPGGGKSTCIIEFIKHKQSIGELNNNNILLLVFNCSSRDDIKGKLNNIVDGNMINTFDKQVIDLNNRNSIEIEHPGADDEEGTKRNEYHEKHNKICISRIVDPNYNIDIINNIKVIIIDEAQDMNYLNYKLVKTISKRLNIPLILVGDTDQSINQFRGSDESFFENHGDRTFTLKVNYRCDQSIIDFAKYISTNKHDIESGSSTGGKKPVYYNCDNDDIAMYDILRKINKEDISLNDMCIIVNTNYEVDMLKKFFKIQNISTGPKKGLQIKTYHKSKGLEYHTVFLYGYKTLSYGGNKRNLKYVGITRTKKELYMYYIDNQILRKKEGKFYGKTYPDKSTECIYLKDVPQELYDIVQL
jgi:DNA helicase IV